MSAFLPMRVGPPERQLFVLLQRPINAPDNGRAVLMCNPFGQEAIRCHRLFRVLGERLARMGFHCVRFDYLGTGDSDGDELECRISQWCEDTLRANEVLARESGSKMISWFGLRLGGSIAALASSHLETHIERLVLWDAIADGTTYLADSRASHQKENMQEYGGRWSLEGDLRHRLQAQVDNQLLGFALSPALRDELESLGPASFQSARARAITAFVDTASKDFAFWESLRATRPEVDVRTLATGVQWASNEAMNSALVPGEALQAVVAALNSS